jgi:hypothetical protein
MQHLALHSLRGRLDFINQRRRQRAHAHNVTRRRYAAKNRFCELSLASERLLVPMAETLFSDPSQKIFKKTLARIPIPAIFPAPLPKGCGGFCATDN